MKRIFKEMKLSLLFVWFCFCQNIGVRQGNIRPHHTERDGFAVVELFTSEGCSSCPGAEAVLARLAAAYPEKMYLLEFHVDYWNRLGWTDPFSSAAYSNRQQHYNQAPGADGVYTPQVIINGTQHLVGSNETGIRRVVDASLSKTVSNSIEISGTMLTDKLVSVKYNCETQEDAALNIALVQLHAQTIVKAGENNGRTLPHIQVVRDFITARAKSGGVQLHLPDGAKAKDFALIAYLQNKKTYAVTGGISGKITSDPSQQ